MRTVDQEVIALHQGIVRVLKGLEAIDVRPLEGASTEQVFDALYGPILTAVSTSCGLLDEALRLFETGSVPPPPALAPLEAPLDRAFDHDVDTLVLQQPSSGRVTDLAFIAGIELRKKRTQLRELTPRGDSWKLIAQLVAARRRVRKSLTAVATMICQSEGLDPELSFDSELEWSLEIRRQYARLVTSIGPDEEIADSQLRGRLRGVGTRIAMLIGRPIYRNLRIEDRHHLRGLQMRILEWLREFEPKTPHFVSGRRLWQDLAGFGRVLSQVSRRQELVHHDGHVVAIACGVLYGGAGRSVVPDGLFAHLLELQGLDVRIDTLLDVASRDAEAWRRPLLDAARGLGRRVPGSSRPPPNWPSSHGSAG